MDDNAVEVVQQVLAETRWTGHPFPVQYLPALARDVLYALEAKFAVVALPEPGELSDHHDEDCRVWYFGQYGELVVFDGEESITDAEGLDFGPGVAREYAAALLAAANAVEESG